MADDHPDRNRPDRTTHDERLKAEFIGNDAMRERYKRYLADRREILATYATGHYRGFVRGEKRYRHG